MTDGESPTDRIKNTESLAGIDPDKAIDQFGTWVDAAQDSEQEDVLKHLVSLAETIRRDAASESSRALLDYFTANLWSALKYIEGAHRGGSWEWEQPAIEHEIIHLRRAIRSRGCLALPVIRVCQFHTNLGNCLSNIGRITEAIDSWTAALKIEPRFGMARANRAIGIWHYARCVYDEGHFAVLSREAWRELDAEKLENLEPGSHEYFSGVRSEIEKALGTEVLEKEFDLHDFSLGGSDSEIAYRQWCLQRCLFLNPLNDAGGYPIASQDILTCPPVVYKIG